MERRRSGQGVFMHHYLHLCQENQHNYLKPKRPCAFLRIIKWECWHMLAALQSLPSPLKAEQWQPSFHVAPACWELHFTLTPELQPLDAEGRTCQCRLWIWFYLTFSCFFMVVLVMYKVIQMKQQTEWKVNENHTFQWSRNAFFILIWNTKLIVILFFNQNPY